VQADRQPQGAGRGVRGAQHAAGLDRDGDRAPEAGVRVEQVREPEEHGRQGEGAPGAEAPLGDPEDDAAEHQLLGHRGRGHEAEQRHRPAQRAPPGHLVAAEERDVGDHRREHPDADQRPPAQSASGAPATQFGDLALLGPADHPAVREQGQHRRREAEDQRERGVPADRRDRLTAGQGDHRDDYELLDQAHDDSFGSPRLGRRGHGERYGSDRPKSSPRGGHLRVARTGDRVHPSPGGYRSAMRLPTLVKTSAAVTAAALAGSLVTKPDSRWYKSLNKPGWQPPRAAFPIVWTGLYGLLAVAGARVLDRSPEPARFARTYGANLALNAGWTLVFFGAKAPRAALAEIALLNASNLALLRQAWAVDRPAGAAIAPYVVWTGFATALTASIAARNR
jgi:benzodiazapine receptor